MSGRSMVLSKPWPRQTAPMRFLLTMTRSWSSGRQSLPVKWLRQALLDLDEIETYVAGYSPDVAVQVVIKIITAVSLLREQPGIGRSGRVPGTKELIVPGLPYIVPYRVKEGVIQVLRVYHEGEGVRLDILIF